MRYGLELNTDIFETNIVNLCVVFAVLVTVVGERIGSALNQRKEKIKNILRTMDKEVDSAKGNWLKAKKIVEIANLRSSTIHTTSTKLIQQLGVARHEQLKNELFLLRRKTEQSIKSERLQKLKAAAKRILYLRLKKAKYSLLKTFDTNDHLGKDTKHQETNQILISKNLNKALTILL
jgi:F-type H+-transporting ATPase subunit b